MNQQHISSNSSSALALIIAFLTFFFIIIIMTIRRHTSKISSNGKLPPGPTSLPIIGNMHQLVTSLPHRRLADLAKIHGPVMYLKLGEVATVVVSSRQAAEEVLRTNDLLTAHRPANIATQMFTYNFRDVAFTPYGDYWRQMRKIFVVHLTSAKQVESFRSVREAAVTTFVKSVMDSSGSMSPVNLSKMLNSLTTSIISRATFGDSCTQVDAFAARMARMSGIMGVFSVVDLFPSVGLFHMISLVKHRAVRLHKEIDDVLKSVISEYRASEEARRTKSKDILGVLLDLQDQGDPEFSLSTESIKAILWDMFFGGIETSATVLTWAMSEILRHPKVMKKVQKEVRQLYQNKSSIEEPGLHKLTYMNAIIKETLRLHPPGPLIPRGARESLTINGFEVPSNARIFVNAWAIGRDPEVWTDAEEFRPERFLETSIDYKGCHYELIPFGSGRRMCPGIMFATSVVELTLANLLYHFDWELSHGLEPKCLDMSEFMGIVVGRKQDLCLVATQHRP